MATSVIKRSKVVRFTVSMLFAIILCGMLPLVYAAAGSFDISFASDSISINTIESKTMTATFRGDGIASISWESSDTRVCSYSPGSTSWVAGGECSTSVILYAKNKGTAYITLNLLDGSGNKLFYKRFKVTVTDLNITFSSSSVTIDKSAQKTVNAQLVGSDIIYVEWVSKNPSICSVEPGKVTWKSAGSTCSASATITGHTPGSTSIVMYLKDYGGNTLFSKSFNVYVNSSSNGAVTNDSVKSITGGTNTKTINVSTASAASITLRQNSTKLTYVKNLNPSKVSSKTGYYGCYKITIQNVTDNKTESKTWNGKQTLKISLSKNKKYKITVAYDANGTYLNQGSAVPAGYTMSSCENPSWYVNSKSGTITSIY